MYNGFATKGQSAVLESESKHFVSVSIGFLQNKAIFNYQVNT